MMIRLAGHFIDNPNHIDKLICIKGLPDDMFFRNGAHGRELIRPWVADVEVNIPKEIRHLCDEFKFVQYFPPIDKDHKGFVDEITALGVKFEYISEAGQTMWERIERYLERSVPRDQIIPKPVLVAPNQKSGFDPHEARRGARGNLELRKADVPVIDLRQPEPTPTVVVQPPVQTATVYAAPVVKLETKQSEPAPIAEKLSRCDPCQKDFNERGLRMHNMKKHPQPIQHTVGV
jgi:hypothetical protein